MEHTPPELSRHGFVLAIVLVVAAAGVAMAGQPPSARVTDQQLKDLVNRIATREAAFHASFDQALDRSPVESTPAEHEIDRFVKYFEQATDFLRDRVSDQRSDTADAENVLRRASFIDVIMMRNRLDASAQETWQGLRSDLNDLARAYGIAWSWSPLSQNLLYPVDEKQVRELLKETLEKTDALDKGLDGAFDRSRLDDPRGKDQIQQSVKDFREVAQRLRDRIEGRLSNTLDVEDVLRRAATIEGLMRRYQLSAQTQQSWLSLRGTLDGLARAYEVAWDWNTFGYTPALPSAGFHHRLTGTYQLENDQGDDPRQVAELAVRGAPADRRQLTYQSLLTRLQAPELIAIERNENDVSMASTRGRRVTIEADGSSHVEQWSAQRTMTTCATLQGERLEVTTTGNRGHDFTVNFDPMENGRSLQMTRTIDEEGLRQPVTIRSSYRRLSDDARWNLDAGGRRDPGINTGSQADEVVVPGGTRFVVVLDNALSTTIAHEGDLYTMTIRSPSQYEGAVIQGFVSTVNDSAGLSGRAGLTLNLRSIRLPNGNAYQFDGFIEDIRTPDGERIRVDREGAGDSLPSREILIAVERGIVGATLGGIIDAVVGRGKGAAIGAVIGAGGGAGSVMLEGRDRLDLQRGTELTVTSGDPRGERTTQGWQR
jgi:hypothetical protein